MYLIKHLLFLVLNIFYLSFTAADASTQSGYKGLYDEVLINDPQPQSAGIYFRMSQKGVNYLTSLASEALPLILKGMPLPAVEVTSFKGENFMVTQMETPKISAVFVDQTGVNVTLVIPFLEVEGEATIDAFVTAESHMSVIVRNWTINIDVDIERNVGDDRNNITVGIEFAYSNTYLDFIGHSVPWSCPCCPQFYWKWWFWISQLTFWYDRWHHWNHD